MKWCPKITVPIWEMLTQPNLFFYQATMLSSAVKVQPDFCSERGGTAVFLALLHSLHFSTRLNLKPSKLKDFLTSFHRLSYSLWDKLTDPLEENWIAPLININKNLLRGFGAGWRLLHTWSGFPVMPWWEDSRILWLFLVWWNYSWTSSYTKSNMFPSNYQNMFLIDALSTLQTIYHVFNLQLINNENSDIIATTTHIM